MTGGNNLRSSKGKTRMEDLVVEYDKHKTKILKYIMFKKRTEKEVFQKFVNIGRIKASSAEKASSSLAKFQ